MKKTVSLSLSWHIDQLDSDDSIVKLSLAMSEKQERERKERDYRRHFPAGFFFFGVYLTPV